MARNPPWTRDELILALDLYFKVNPLHTSGNHPEIKSLSVLLNKLPAQGHAADAKLYRMQGLWEGMVDIRGCSRHDPFAARDKASATFHILRDSPFDTIGLEGDICIFRRNPATIPRPNRPLFRRESGHRSEGNSAGVPSRFRPLFLGGSELTWTVPD